MHCVTSTGQLLECLSWDKTSGRERSGTRTGERKWERRSREKRERVITRERQLQAACCCVWHIVVARSVREISGCCVLSRLLHRRGSLCQGNIWLLRAVASGTSSWLAVAGKDLEA